MRSADIHSWLVAAAAALLGWLFVLLVGVVVPVGWALVGGGVLALAVAALYARARRLRPLRAAGLAFVCITVEWPVLLVVYLIIAYWVGGPPQD